MMELVPFQSKRGKTFLPNTTVEQALEQELVAFFKKEYPTLLEILTLDTETSKQSFTSIAEKQTLYTTTIQDVPRLVELIRILAPVTSPAYINDSKYSWTLHRLDSPVVALSYLAEKLSVTFPIDLLPKPYRAILRYVYSDAEVLKSLAINIASAKRASKYLRILQKRLGIYKKKKLPFTIRLNTKI